MDFISIIIIVLGVVALIYLRNGAIPLPTHTDAVDNMVRMSGIKPMMKIADLGSGDGRIVLAFAKAGALADGYEINPLMIWWSRLKIRKQKNAKIISKSFWSVDFSGYDVIVVFGMTHIMERLAKKLEAELKPGTIVVSNVFKFPGWNPVVENDGIRVYRR